MHTKCFNHRTRYSAFCFLADMWGVYGRAGRVPGFPRGGVWCGCGCDRCRVWVCVGVCGCGFFDDHRNGNGKTWIYSPGIYPHLQLILINCKRHYIRQRQRGYITVISCRYYIQDYIRHLYGDYIQPLQRHYIRRYMRSLV